jgi:hypothetical protein
MKFKIEITVDNTKNIPGLLKQVSDKVLKGYEYGEIFSKYGNVLGIFMFQRGEK